MFMASLAGLIALPLMLLSLLLPVALAVALQVDVYKRQPLSQVPFGPVDGLILSTLSYVRFQELVPDSPSLSVPLQQAAEAFLAPVSYTHLPTSSRSRWAAAPITV